MTTNMGYFRQIVKQLLLVINRPIQKSRRTAQTYITCSGNYDGIGAQVHATLSTMLFAKSYGLIYVHTPFAHIEHNRANTKNWVQEWENFFCLGDNEISMDSLQPGVSSAIALRHPLKVWKRKKTLFQVNNCHEFADLQPDFYEAIIPAIKTKFSKGSAGSFLSKKPNQPKKIAIHVRRGDVTFEGKNKVRFTRDIDIILVLERVLSYLKSKHYGYEIHVFSQGSLDDFKAFCPFEVQFHLNENEFETFTSLVSADILLTAKSSFSYAAALLTEAFVIYDEFWHKPLSRWGRFSDPGNLTLKKIARFFEES